MSQELSCSTLFPSLLSLSGIFSFGFKFHRLYALPDGETFNLFRLPIIIYYIYTGVRITLTKRYNSITSAIFSPSALGF